MIDFLNSLDTTIFLFINGLHNPFLDKFMFVFSSKWVWVPMYAMLLFILFRTFGLKKTLVYVGALGMALLLADQMCATVIRPLVERMRPSNPDNPLSQFVHIVNDYRGGRYGFPSCHASNSFALAGFIALLMRRHYVSSLLLVWAVLNSYSRVYLGVHYPGDLFVGACLGLLFAFICFRSVNLFFESRPGIKDVERFRRPLFRYHSPLTLAGGNSHLTIDVTLGRLLVGVVALTILFMTANAIVLM